MIKGSDIPDETIIYSSSRSYLITVLLLIGAGIVFFNMSSSSDNSAVWIFFIAFIGYLVYQNFIAMQNPKLLFTLNYEGISTYKTPLFKWSQIKSEQVIYQHNFFSSRRGHWALTFDHPNGTVSIDLTHSDIEIEKLESLLYHYRYHPN